MPEPALESLRYRFGFLLHRTAELVALPSGCLPDCEWEKHEVGAFRLWRHPEACLEIRRAGARTLIALGDVFDAMTGAAANLSAVVEAVDDEVVYREVERLGGRFALILIEGSRARVFHDAIGSRSVFYHAGAPFCIASHAALVARAVRTRRSDEVSGLLDHALYKARDVKFLPGDLTLYEKVYGLIPNTLLDSGPAPRGSAGVGPSTRRYWPRAPLRSTAPDTFFDMAQSILTAHAAFVSSRYKALFGLTGGVDTRTVFAAFHATGTPFETVTWRGRQFHPHEAPVVERLSQYLAVPHLDLSMGKGPTGQVAAIASENGGGYRGRIRTAERMSAAYGPHSGHAFVRCWGGEIMRGFYNTFKTPMRRASTHDMVRSYGGSWIKEKASGPTGALVWNAFEGFRQRGQYDGLDTLGYDVNDFFYWEHRMGMWGAGVNNELDVAMPTLIGMNSRQLYDAAFGLPRERRLTKRLLLEVIDRFDPNLARIPLAPIKPANQVSVGPVVAPNLAARTYAALQRLIRS